MKHRCSIFSIENTMRPLLRLRLFGKARDGAIMIIGGLMAGLLVAVGGASVDFGLRYVSHQGASIAADAAAIAASSSRLYEGWGKVPEGSGLGPQVTARQQNLAGTYYRLNTRDYNVDPDFTPTIQVEDVGDVVRTTINGRSMVATRFISLVGVDQLPYTVNTVTDMRKPSEKAKYDIVMMLDNTSSMLQPLSDGDTRRQAMRRAAKILNKYILCGNEEGENCDENFSDNRVGVIPYALRVSGLNQCDLLSDVERPQWCNCLLPRGYAGGWEAWNRLRGHEGGMPETCRYACERVDEAGRPASDPGSFYFSCGCGEEENPPSCDTPLSSLSSVQLLYYIQCKPKCLDGGCCPSRRCFEPFKSRTCMQEEADSIPDSPCCDKPGPIICQDEQLGRQCYYTKTPSVQTVCCDRQNCTASCTAEDMLNNPCNKEPKPQWCTMTGGGGAGGGSPGMPGLGSLPAPLDSDGVKFANHEFFGKDAVRANYLPEQDFNYDGKVEPNIYLTESGNGGVGIHPWVRSLRECKDDQSAQRCMTAIDHALDGWTQEDFTNSYSAFEAFRRYSGYLNFMRPNEDGDDEKTVNVVVWLTDGQNTAFEVWYGDAYSIDPRPPTMIPRIEWIPAEKRWQNPRTELDLIKANRYIVNNTGVKSVEYVPPGSPGYNAALTAQQWSDRETLVECERLRERVVNGQPRPVIIYTVALGGVASQTSPEGIHTRKLMTECSYGTAYGPGEDLPDDRPKLFFAVENSRDLNRAFRTIAGSLGNIRIVK